MGYPSEVVSVKFDDFSIMVYENDFLLFQYSTEFLQTRFSFYLKHSLDILIF